MLNVKNVLSFTIQVNSWVKFKIQLSVPTLPLPMMYVNDKQQTLR